MTLRRFLLVPLIVSVVLFVYFSADVKNSFSMFVAIIQPSSDLLWVLTAAVALQMAGHVLRAYKMRILLSSIKDSSTRFQFRALSIGYLFNTILPFRLGELIRARIVSGGMNISFSLALVFVIFERAVDALILAMLGLLFIPSIAFIAADALTVYVVGLLVIGLIIFVGLFMVVKQNKILLRGCYSFTKLFNENIMHGLRFKLWSVIYGLQQSLRPTQILRYVGLSVGSWILYVASIFVLAKYFFTQSPLGEKIALAIAPYFGVAIPAGPANLGVFSNAINTVTGYLQLTYAQALSFNLITWALLVLPIATIGLVLLFGKTKETLWSVRPKQATKNSLINKLHRSEDISSEMASFLENYFSGNTLSRIVHRLELNDNFRLLKYFRGGSDAITILVLQNDQEVVKKIIPLEFENRLKAQHDWLKERDGKSGIVKLLGEEKAKDYYAIDLQYRSSDQMFYEFIHRNPIKDSTKIMTQVWEYLYEAVYHKPEKIRLHEKERKQYIDKHIINCLEKAAVVDPDLLQAVAPEYLIINGKRYDNLYQILDKIKNHPKAWSDIAMYQKTSAVHGDVIIDNLLVSGNDASPLIIDPAPDGNIINGPVFDFGKNLQSLYCGYEFLLRDEDPVSLTTENVINYRQHSSAQYNQLCKYVRDELAPAYLSEQEQRAMLFHAGALHIRRLKHQVYYTPVNVLKFYAVGVKTLNDFFAQYE